MLSCLRVIKPGLCFKKTSAKYIFNKEHIRNLSAFNIKNYNLFKLDEGPNTKAELNKKDALKIYKQMQGIRKLETAIGNLYKAKQVRGFCHLYNGQEACAVGIDQVLRPEDLVISSYRIHGWCYLMSEFDAYAIFSELIGKQTGLSKGRGGSMHMYTRNFYGGNGIVGAQIPIGTGLAFTIKYFNTKGASFVLFGDGCANQGQVFEAFNMAKLWNLPCIFVCENNEYGMGTSSERSSANTEYYTRGDYIPGIRVDGMDVLAVREATKFAIDYCMNDKGPLLLEIKTYRQVKHAITTIAYYGHSMSDPGTSYRTREEVQNVRLTKDPIKTFVKKITDSSLVTPDELKAIDSEIQKSMEEATKRAAKETELPVEDLTADIYKMSRECDIRGTSAFSLWKHNNRIPPR